MASIWLKRVLERYISAMAPLLFGIGGLLATSERLFSEEWRTDDLITEATSELAEIAQAGRSGDLDRLEQIGERVEAEAHEWRWDLYYRLMHAVVSSIGSRDFGQPEREALLERRYATLALDKPSPIPLEIEIHLLLRLQEDMGDGPRHSGQGWGDFRAARVSRWLKAWVRLEGSIDEADEGEPDESFSLNVPLPVGVPGFFGMDPKHIGDPVLRATHEAAIARNAEKARKQLERRRLHDLSRLFIPSAENYIITAYSRPPFALDELRQELHAHAAFHSGSARLAEARSRILKAVGDEMARQTAQILESP